MKIRILLAAVVLIGLLFSLPASAQNALCVCDDPQPTPAKEYKIPMARNIDTLIGVEKFNSSLGCLQEVRLTAKSCGYIWAEVDNEDNLSQEWEYVATSGISVVLPESLGETHCQFGTVDGPETIPTGADDPSELPPGDVYNPDYEGPDYSRTDYGTRTNPTCCEPEEGNGIFILDSSAALELFSGTGLPGDTVNVLVQTSGSSGLTPGQSANVGYQSFSEMDATITVEYVYCPPSLACINGSKVGCDNEPLSGWTITLTKPDGSTATDVTDDNGEYSFCDLPAGSYKVCEETRPGWYPVGQT